MPTDSAPPALPEPDTKDWTWVLGEPCPDCGYDASPVTTGSIGDRTRAAMAPWAEVLLRPDAASRPSPAVWSPLEYACHVRDVCRLFDHRLDLVLTEQDPEFANWDQDQTAVQERYDRQVPGTVATEIVAATAVIADAFDAVPATAWGRTGRRSDGAVFTVETLGRYFLHDLVHHLHDVGAPA